jgi:hypothetical protein
MTAIIVIGASPPPKSGCIGHIYEKLKHLVELRKSGVITEDEV